MYIEDIDLKAVVEQIKRLPRQDSDTVLMLMGEHSTIDIHKLMEMLNSAQIPYAGAIFPGVIYGDKKYDKGIVVSVIPTVIQPSIVEGLNEYDFKLMLPQLDMEGQEYTALILVDGLTKYIAQLLEKLSHQLDHNVSFIGGGAGSLSFEQKPCVFDNRGIYQDTAMILWIKASSQLGVRHGWQHLRGPHTATQTDGTIVCEIDGKPAFDFYRQIIETRTGKTLNHDNFFDIAKEYPLGIYHPGVDRIVRDPITFTDDGALVCVGEVPERSMVYILRGNKQSLINHARRATHEALENSQDVSHYFIVDCISRVLYLEDDFSKELSAVSETLENDATTPFGVLSLGEIATYGTGRVEFFNKTFVVGALSTS